jgi:hypothetical protein
LAAVLWLLAGLSIVVALVSEAALTAKQRIAQLRERTDFIQNAISARAELEYRLSASRPTIDGLTDGVTLIKTDNTPYQVGAKSLVQLQDQGGLISLNIVSRPLLDAYLQKCGVPAERTEPLLDALEDYTDADNLARINGAERETYALNGLKGPRNSPLLSVPELWSVWGWAAYRSTLEKNDCVSSFTTYGEASFGGRSVNPATAPAPVLAAMGFEAEAVQSMVTARVNPDEVPANASPIAVGGGGLFGQAAYSLKSLRIRHSHPTGPWVMEYSLTLDSNNPDLPWTVGQLSMGASSAAQPAVGKLQPRPWPQEPPSVTTSDAAKLLNL